MISVSICICTRRRKEGLKKLLESLEKLQTPSNTNVRIIIVENDSQSQTRFLVMEFCSKSRFEIRYFLEQQQGIVFARNRSVKEAGNCDFCCFIDDDQIVASDWLVELLKCQKEFSADAVWGTAHSIFSNRRQIPVYIKQFYIPVIYTYGTIVKEAYTNCLLMKKGLLDMFDGPFDARLNFMGGEDIYLTNLITRKGGQIRFNPNAIAYEIIPDFRTTIKYIIHRTYRNRNTSLFVNSLIFPQKPLYRALPRLLVRFCYGSVIVIPFFILGRKNKLKGLIKIADAVGGFFLLLGRHNKFYK